MNTNVLKFLALILGFTLWAALAYLKMVPPEPLVALLQMALGGLVTHMLQATNDTTTTTPTAEPAKGIAPGVVTAQAGFARPMLLAVVATLMGLSLLAGCTTTTASAYSGLYTQAKAGVQVFDDNTLKTMRDLLCAQPYSAIQRNSDMQPGIVTLCGPLANISSLDANQLQLLMNVMNASGVKLQSVPAAPATPASGAK